MKQHEACGTHSFSLFGQAYSLTTLSPSIAINHDQFHDKSPAQTEFRKQISSKNTTQYEEIAENAKKRKMGDYELDWNVSDIHYLRYLR